MEHKWPRSTSPGQPPVAIRPYRKALDVREALHRLEDAAGTQLDPTLVRTFVHAYETAPDVPVPGRLAQRRDPWTLLEGAA